MASTTEAAIRDRIIELIRGLVPDVDSTTTFRLYEDQRGANFRRYARGAPQAAARMFQVRSVPTRQQADAGNTDIEARLVTFDVIIAYPQTHRWGSGGARDRDRARESDQKLIENAIGRNGQGNFTGTHPNASWMSQTASKSQTATTWELSDAEGDVDFLVVRQTMRYFRANTPAWTIDATSGKGVPADASEWATVLAAVGIASGGPTALYLCQDTGGNLADTLGGGALAAVGSGQLYQQTVPGWSRKAAELANTTNRFERSFVNTATTSVLLLLYVSNLSVPATGAAIAGFGSNTVMYGSVLLSGTTTVRARSTNLADGATNAFGTDVVRPVVMQVDVTGQRTRYFSDTERLSPSWAPNAGSLLALGAVGGGTSISGRYLYGAAFTGPSAEISELQVKTLLQTLGWSIAWS